VLWVAPHLEARPQSVALVGWLSEELLRTEGRAA
jgi:hypothetical protein